MHSYGGGLGEVIRDGYVGADAEFGNGSAGGGVVDVDGEEVKGFRLRCRRCRCSLVARCRSRGYCFVECR